MRSEEDSRFRFGEHLVD